MLSFFFFFFFGGGVCVGGGGGGGFECSLCKHLVDRVCLQYYLKKIYPEA